MPNKDFFKNISSFEEAMRKFEEALIQSQQAGSGRPGGVPPGRGGQGPGQARPPQRNQRPDWARPNEDPGYLVIDDPAMSEDDNDEGETLERADWLPQTEEAADIYAVRADAFKGKSEESGLGESISSEGIYSETSEDSRSRLSGLTTMTESGNQASTSNWWDDSVTNASQRGRAGTLPPALAHLDRYANPLIQGVIWAEVLGRPVSKRRGRGRNGI